MTGLRASALSPMTVIEVSECQLEQARTFSAVPKGTGFWYENANGLVEIAVNQGRANQIFKLAPGTPVLART